MCLTPHDFMTPSPGGYAHRLHSRVFEPKHKTRQQLLTGFSESWPVALDRLGELNLNGLTSLGFLVRPSVSI